VTETDYYEQLGIERTATRAEIDAAYYRTAVGAEPERVRELETAHRVLTDPVRRARYDSWLGGDGAGASPAAPVPPPEPVGNATLGFLGALAAAFAGAVVWALVVRATDYEVGVLAWGIGFAAAGAARIAARGSGPAVQLGAAVAAGFGVLLGKYLGYALLLQEQFPGAVGLFSGDMVRFFREDLGNVFGLFDLLWLALAVGTAWYLLRPQEGAERATAVPPPPPREEEHPYLSRNPVDRLTRRLPHGWRIAIDWIVTIVGAVAIVLAIKAWVINPYRIPSSSMEPTLHCARPADGCEAGFSDRVLANRFIYHLREPERGEIVVFETPPAAQLRCGAGGTFVKRLVGLPGETVELRPENGDTFVYVNGQRLDEPYLELERRSAGEAETFRIPQGHYFMLGDNRTKSCDSREWGTVPRENLIGKVFATYWPPNRISFR